MRKFWIFAVFIAVLIGCDTGSDPVNAPISEEPIEAPSTPSADPATEPPTMVVNTRPVWVMNSNWEIVRTDAFKAAVRYSSVSRVIDSLDALKEEIAIHNAAHPENPWRIYIDTVPSIEDAPMAEIWIADPVTNVLKTNPSDGSSYHLLVDRVLVSGRRWAWEMDAAAVGGKLYIDYPPPPEVPAPVYDDAYWYAYYSLYVVGSTGLIHYQIHITEEDWAAGGYTSRDNMFEQKYMTYNAIAVGDGVGQPDSPWHVVARQLYIEP